ncbi:MULTISPECIES: pyridoxamine 5'-phosphate oxidase family protein [unclassified Virgibacillus]|uniref:pyridoxamine 5'-phosphate oxidase family protein n=1 Tax=unclassified Virgibacillus TaxID=2620237 RepID=UPI0024DE3A80|nr:pyridoxamine 5'-phosphate oxidase family protein [Virgibacillus sp. LDC-1]
MDQQSLKASIEKIMDESYVGTLATVKQNKPFTRYMTFQHQDLKLYTATSKATDKTEEIEENPYVHVLLGYEGEGFGDDYVEYEGKATINTSQELKDKLWNDYMENWFDGPTDENFVVLEIEPKQIQLMNKKGEAPQVLQLHE